jgi:DNA (cytosine-5)-methyltransferase 1
MTVATGKLTKVSRHNRAESLKTSTQPPRRHSDAKPDTSAGGKKPRRKIKPTPGKGPTATSRQMARPWEVFTPIATRSKRADLTHVSLFSGCGGFDLGFHQAGFKTVFANDINPDACATYRQNIGEISDQDVRVVGVPELNKCPDVLTAGFPCQPFSNAGSRQGVKDSTSGTLYQTALAFVRDLHPKSVVFENVRGLLSFHDGEKLLVQEICEKLDSLGYNVVFSLIDASRHHVPQKRLRLFIVGVERTDAAGVFTFPHPVDRDDLSLKHTILDLNKKVANQNELMQLNPQAIKLGSMVPEGGSWKNIPYKKLPERLKKISDNMERYRWPNFYRRYHRDEIAGTITAAFKPENAGVWHPIEKRIFSVREIARIQTFPDWFHFAGRTIKSKYQQIGNAVPPRLAYEIAMQIKAVLGGADLRGQSEYMSFEQFVDSGKPLRARDSDVIFSHGRPSRNAKRGARGNS